MVENSDSTTSEMEYEVKISYDQLDNEWDDFVRQTPGSNYTQTSRWTQVQAIRNWRCLRIILRSKHKIVGGAQILFKPLPIIGSVGYLTRGPVCDFSNTALVREIIQEIQKIRRQKHIVYLAITLPANAGKAVHLFSDMGFHKSNSQYGEIASVVIDLKHDIDTILSQMTIDKRKTIHRIERRKNLDIREGTQKDIPTFFRLHSISGQRQGFTPHSELYFQKLWEVFEPQGNIKLFLSEFEGEHVSSCICIPFNNRVSGTVIGWSGAHSNLYPNDAIIWEVIRWSKAAGYHFFDFGGLSPDCAQAIKNKGELSKQENYPRNLFKLNYGGNIVFYPDDLDNINVPLFEFGYKTFFSMKNSVFLSDAISKIYRRRTEK
jgi:peptidoglycan pentaglycine glycine transferase (the first glycine)